MIGLHEQLFDFFHKKSSLNGQEFTNLSCATYLSESLGGTPVVQQVKRWPTDLAVPGPSPA